MKNYHNPIHEFFQAAGHYATQVMARRSKHQAEIMDIPDAPDFIIYISLVYFHLQIITKADILRQGQGENSFLGNYMLGHSFTLLCNLLHSIACIYWNSNWKFDLSFMKYFKKPLFFVGFLLSTILPISLKAQIGNVNQDAEEKPKLVVLGTYHMATTTSNVINTDVDDVTTPERQKEMLELMEKLKNFKPTKIALECDYEVNDKAQKQYDDYLAGNLELTRNEVHQIGFRLGKELGHKKVYCIDWGIFPDDPLYNYETYSKQHPALNEYLNELYKDNEEQSLRSAEKIASKSIIDNLIDENQPESIDIDHQGYFNLLRIAKGDEYVGANYLSWWYGRNLKILANIIRFTESSNDRILVVYGAGHNKLLNQLAIESAFYEVESPLKYLRD